MNEIILNKVVDGYLLNVFKENIYYIQIGTYNSNTTRQIFKIKSSRLNDFDLDSRIFFKSNNDHLEGQFLSEDDINESKQKTILVVKVNDTFEDVVTDKYTIVQFDEFGFVHEKGNFCFSSGLNTQSLKNLINSLNQKYKTIK